MQTIEGTNPVISVTEDGQVFKAGRLLTPTISCYGYPEVPIKRYGLHQKIAVHRLIAEAFVPIDPARLQVNHKDGVKTNNHFSNLEWVTPQENTAHAKANGLIRRIVEKESLSPRAILSATDARFILGHPQVPAKDLAEHYGVDLTSIYNVLNGKTWGHLRTQADIDRLTEHRAQRKRHAAAHD